MVSGSFWANIAQGNHQCNVGQWQTDNFYEQNDLSNVVSTMLGQNCLGILSSQYCPNTSETTLHKKTTCAMLVQSPGTTLHRKIICNGVLIYVGQHCARSLPAQCWRMVNTQLFLAK